MKLPIALLSALSLVLAAQSGQPKPAPEADAPATIKAPSVATAPRDAAAPAIDFSWRDHKGDFPQDKPGYLILTTEDAVIYSQVLPEFVKHKENMGYYVYVATEKDYGSDLTGREQCIQVRKWLCEIHPRINGKYLLLIGDSSPGSNNLPAPPRPDGEHTGFDEPYRDIDGKCGDQPGDWIYSYIYNERATGPKRTLENSSYEFYTGRVNYVGNEVGNGAFDLDQVLRKFIRYELETVAGKNLDWRSQVLSVISNYGGSPWDIGLWRAVDEAGASFEHDSESWHMLNAGGFFPMIPDNYAYGKASTRSGLSAGMFMPIRQRGLMSNMSHGHNRGSEGIIGQSGLLSELDSRYPAAMAMAACTAMHPADNMNMGQSHIRRDSIFAMGTAHSGNLGRRVPFLQKILIDRMTTGEAAQADMIGVLGQMCYGDPSLQVVPPKGQPLRALELRPVLTSTYVERTADAFHPLKPVQETYTLTNHSQTPIKLEVVADVDWLDITPATLTLAPGATQEISAKTNASINQLTPAHHIATLRFIRQDGQEDVRIIGLVIRGLECVFYHSFDTVLTHGNNQYITDPTVGPFPGYHNKGKFGFLTLTQPPADQPDQIPAVSFASEGKVGGAVRFHNAPRPWRQQTIEAYFAWCGLSASFWVKIDELPADGKTSQLAASPIPLVLNSDGTVELSLDKQSAKVGTLTPGQWHFVQLRTDLHGNQAKARIDGGSEASIPHPDDRNLGGFFTVGQFNGCLDELKIWRGELSDSDQDEQWKHAALPMAVNKPLPEHNSLRNPETRLEWRAAEMPAGTVYHVYLGESKQAVATATAQSGTTYLGETQNTFFNLPTLKTGTHYYWRVDAVPGSQTDSASAAAIAGKVWAFKTTDTAAPYTVVRPLDERPANGRAPHTDGHRDLMVQTPVYYSFPAIEQPEKAVLFVKTFFPHATADYVIERIDGQWDASTSPADLAKLPRTEIARGKAPWHGIFIDVTDQIEPGKPTRFCISTSSRGFNVFSTSCREDSLFPGGHYTNGSPIKLLTFDKPDVAQPFVFWDDLNLAVTLSDQQPSLDIAPSLFRVPATTPVTFSAEGLPDWVTVSRDGVVSLTRDADLSKIDFGGYDGFLNVSVAGETRRLPFKVKIPLPEIRFRMDRRADGTLAFVPVNEQLSPGVIRYTLDGSPVTADSPIYKEPFTYEEGIKPTARFFLYNEYPYAPVTAATPFGIPRTNWKVTRISGDPRGIGHAPKAFDGNLDTVWGNVGGQFPQSLDIDLGEEHNLSALLVKSTIRNAEGRIKDFSIYTSTDGTTWTTAKSGTLPNTPTDQMVEFDKTAQTRFVRIEVTSLHAGENMVITELEAYAK